MPIIHKCRGVPCGALVAGIHVAEEAHGGIRGEHALEPLRGLGGSIGYDHLTRVDRVADADATAMMYADPRRAARGVEQRVQDRPVRNRI